MGGMQPQDGILSHDRRLERPGRTLPCSLRRQLGPESPALGRLAFRPAESTPRLLAAPGSWLWVRTAPEQFTCISPRTRQNAVVPLSLPELPGITQLVQPPGGAPSAL